MLKEARNFVESLLSEANTSTIKNAIRVFNLPVLLERTLTEIYVEGLGIKQIADRHSVDDRTVKRWKKAAIDTVLKAAQDFGQHAHRLEEENNRLKQELEKLRNVG